MDALDWVRTSKSRPMDNSRRMATDERTRCSSANLLIERISGSASLTVKRNPRVILIVPNVDLVFMSDTTLPGPGQESVFDKYWRHNLQKGRIKLESILRRAKSAGIQFEPENVKELERISELQDLLHDAERARAGLAQDGEETVLHDEVIAKVRQEIRTLSDKIK
jgi:hypothetical protein